MDDGVPEECVSVLLGHASTETTARYYARTRERAAIRAVRDVWENERRMESKEMRYHEDTVNFRTDGLAIGN